MRLAITKDVAVMIIKLIQCQILNPFIASYRLDIYRYLTNKYRFYRYLLLVIDIYLEKNRIYERTGPYSGVTCFFFRYGRKKNR